MTAPPPKAPIDISFLDGLDNHTIASLINQRVKRLLLVKWGVLGHETLSRHTTLAQRKGVVAAKLHACVDLNGVEAVNRALKASGRSFFRKRRFPVVPACLEASMAGDFGSAIDVRFLASISDPDVDLLVDQALGRNINFFDMAMEQVWGVLDPRKEQLRRIESDHPHTSLAVRCLIKRHGDDALYQALEADGRMYFRDKRFAANLGL